MSLLPFLLHELQAQPRRHHHHHRQYDLEDLLEPQDLLLLRGAPWRGLEIPSGSSLKNDSNEFKVNLDVQQFKPEEVSVKVVDNFIVVEGKHEERQDEHGFIQRHFQRRYLIPKDVDPNTIQSSLSSDGVLSVAAPKKAITQGGERKINIVHTNQPAITSQSKAEAKQGEGDKK